MRAQIGVGILGFGVAGRLMAAAVENHPEVRLVAVAEPGLDGDVSVAGRAVPSVHALEDLCADVDVEAVFVATPTELHRKHVEAVLVSGRAVVVEKPMAVSLEEAQSMVAAADAVQRPLIVGHSQSFEPPIRAIREVILSGDIGPVRMVTALNGTDWMYRPRRPADFDVRLGGGVTLRQGAHHFDVVRYITGGALRTVSAAVGRWAADRGPSPALPADGAYSAFVDTEDGAVATVTYNGYDRFPATELTFGISESGQEVTSRPGQTIREMVGLDASTELALQHNPDNLRDTISRPGAYVPAFGFLLVSGTDGDIRITRDGLAVYSANGVRQFSLAGWSTGREAVIEELVAACRDGRSPVHDGRWGMATLEVCLAVLESADTGQVIRLSHQTRLGGEGPNA